MPVSIMMWQQQVSSLKLVSLAIWNWGLQTAAYSQSWLITYLFFKAHRLEWLLHLFNGVCDGESNE